MNDAVGVAKSIIDADPAERRALLRQARSVPGVAAELKRRADAELHRDGRAAVRVARVARTAGRVIGDPHARALGDHALAKALHSTGRHADAAPLYESAAAAYAEVGLAAERAKVESALVALLGHLGRHLQAEDVAKRARARFRRLGDVVGAAKVANNLATLRQNQDRHRDAVRILERIRPELERAGERGMVADVDLNRANSYSLLCRFDRSTALYRQARAVYQELGRDERVALVDYNLAYDHFLQGRSGEARALFAAARSAFRRCGQSRGVVLVALDESEILLLLGDYEQALRLAEEARTTFAGNDEPIFAARAALFAARAARELGDGERATELIERARREFVRAHHPAGVAATDLALSETSTGSASERYRLARRAADAFRRLGLHDRAALAAIVMGNVDSARNRHTRARTHLERALRTARRYRLTEIELRAEHGLAQLCEQRGDKRRALQRYRGAVAAFERLRGGLSSDVDRLTFAADRHDVLVDALRSALDLGRVDEAFELVERARSRALVDLVCGDVRASNAILARARNRKIANLKRALAALQARVRSSERSGAGLEASDFQQFRRLAAELDESYVRLARANPEAAYALVGRGVVDIEQTREVLGDERVLLEYFCEGDRVGALFIGTTEIEVFRNLCLISEVDGALSQLRFTLGSPAFLGQYGRPESGARLAAALAPLEELRRLLLAPIETRIGDRHLVVVPHATMHLVPFAALTRDGRPLIADREVSVSPSATSHVALCKRPPAARGALVVSVPDQATPCLADEAREVVRQLDAVHLADTEATATRLRQASRGVGIVHVCAHGRYEPETPSLSGLELADGRLIVAEVAALELNAELVTLSACESGAGAPRGDEVLGLTRAFLQAGARTVVASLWAVNDASTADFMRLFYGQITEGSAVTAALQKAALTVREQHPHPYHWAPFTVIGPGSPVRW